MMIHGNGFTACRKNKKKGKCYKMKSYQERKAAARETAVQWQQQDSDYPYSYEGLLILQEYFYKLGKRYGLLTEFRENGIPC